jgi:hypothetical protein
MDIVEDPKGESFFVDQKKPDNSSLYWAMSISRPELGALDVSDKDSRRLISIEELPKAVRGPEWATGLSPGFQPWESPNPNGSP